MAVFTSWFIAQALKVVFYWVREREINFRRFVEPGGMPSAHAAMTISLLTGVGLKEGISSTYFVIALVFAMVTIYDAAGVRRAVGKQAEILNRIIRDLRSTRVLNREALMEWLGHTPLEVIVGGGIGFFISLILI